MIRRIAVVAALLTTSAASAGCAVLDFTCDNYRTKDDVMNSWLGDSLDKYERQRGLRAFSTMPRPQNRTEYSYVAYDEWIADSHYECTERLVVDNETGEIVGWSYEGNQCVGYCAD